MVELDAAMRGAGASEDYLGGRGRQARRAAGRVRPEHERGRARARRGGQDRAVHRGNAGARRRRDARRRDRVASLESRETVSSETDPSERILAPSVLEAGEQKRAAQVGAPGTRVFAERTMSPDRDRRRNSDAYVSSLDADA